jgi:glutamine amidotransferase
MCRLAAYTGPSIVLEHFLFTPSHGLMEQAWSPREMQEALLNADGFGFGWFPADDRPGIYVNPMPIWTDVNLRDLSRALTSHQWLANVRSATRRMPVNPFNTMPFTDGAWLFMHNGFIHDFANTLRAPVRDALTPEVEAGVRGNTDSEYIFGLVRQYKARHAGSRPDQILMSVLNDLNGWLGDTKALLNIVLGDGHRIYALRHAVNGDCPSLYYTAEDAEYPGGQLVASERLTESDSWQPVPEHSLLILDAAAPPQLISL